MEIVRRLLQNRALDILHDCHGMKRNMPLSVNLLRNHNAHCITVKHYNQHTTYDVNYLTLNVNKSTFIYSMVLLDAVIIMSICHFYSICAQLLNIVHGVSKTSIFYSQLTLSKMSHS